MKTTIDIINDFAIESVCPTNLMPKTPTEITMVRLFKDFGIKLVDKLVGEGNLSEQSSRPDITVADPKEVVRKAAQASYEKWQKSGG